MPLVQEDQQKYKSLYLQTSRQLILELKDNLTKLSSGQASEDILDDSHRTFHSLKGQSEMMEFHAIGTLSRLLEYTFAAKKEGNLDFTNEIIKKMQDSVTAIETCLLEIEKNNKESDLSQVTEEMKSLVPNVEI